jgi:hypothetical protein
VDRCWQAFLRRFDLEHTFRFAACHAKLCLARPLADDLRLPWQRPAPAGRQTPARVRRGFRSIRETLPSPTAAPKPGKPGPGRPPGSRNRHPAARHDVGKTTSKKKPTKRTKKTAPNPTG